MTDINQVSFTGRVVKDVVLQQSNNGVSFAQFSVATNRSKFDKAANEWKEDVTFVPLVIFGKTAENLFKYLTKGKQVGIEGVLDHDEWEKDGARQYRLRISVTKLKLFSDGGQTKADAPVADIELTEQANEFSPVPGEDYKEFF